jgi:cytochrome P450
MADGDDLPKGLQLTPLDDAFRADPYAIFGKLRTKAPVHLDDTLRRYLLTRHDHVKDLLHDRDFLTDPRKANEGTFPREVLAPRLVQGEEISMLLMDEPEHKRLRALVSAPFKPGAVQRWRPHIREIVERTLDAIEGDEFDLIQDFAGPIPAIVIAEMLGVDAQQHDDFKIWSDLAVQVGFNPFPTPEQVQQAAVADEKLCALFRDEIARHRKSPQEDLMSDLINAQIDGERLSEDEIIVQCRLLLVAGNVTTTDLIGNGVKALLDNPGQLQKLRDNPELIANAVEEMLRYDSPVLNSGRIADRDIEVAGCPIKRGEMLSLTLGAANRDPAVYPEPDRFDIEREDTHHHSFGGGRHLCLGAHLARMEAQQAILGLLQRYSTLRLGPRGCQFHAIPAFRGYSELWISTRH